MQTRYLESKLLYQTARPTNAENVTKIDPHWGAQAPAHGGVGW